MNRRNGRLKNSIAVRSQDLLVENESDNEQDPNSPHRQRSYSYPHRPKKVGLQIHEGLYGK